MLPDEILAIAKKVVEIMPDFYGDFAKQSVQETGKALGRIPRAINAAFAPLEKWILRQEYSVSETKLLLDQKLANLDPAKIVEPEPHIAIPALQAISYVMDSVALRDLYANLLSKAMLVDSKESVHPSFVECIKQMSPLDAENITFFTTVQPVAQYTISFDKGPFFTPLLTNIFLGNPQRTDVFNQSISLSALQRLGLLDIQYGNRKVTSDDAYTPYIEHIKTAEEFSMYRDLGLNIDKGAAVLTPYGKAFMECCVKPPL